MRWYTGIFIYFLIWWVVLFAVLPWGVRVPDQAEPGHAPSAPVNPRLWAKVIATSLVSLIIWLAVYALIQSGWLSIKPA